MNVACIICNATDNRETVEHIIPQSLGNEYYVLPKGVICFNCNNRIAKVEYRVVSSSVFMDQRIKYKLIRSSKDHFITDLRNDDLLYFTVKIGFEGLYKSRRKMWENINWEDVRSYLLNRELGMMVKERIHPDDLKYKPIPRWIERFRLRNKHLTLEYAIQGHKLYVRFQFGTIRVWARLK